MVHGRRTHIRGSVLQTSSLFSAPDNKTLTFCTSTGKTSEFTELIIRVLSAANRPVEVNWLQVMLRENRTETELLLRYAVVGHLVSVLPSAGHSACADVRPYLLQSSRSFVDMMNRQNQPQDTVTPVPPDHSLHSCTCILCHTSNPVHLLIFVTDVASIAFLSIHVT